MSYFYLTWQKSVDNCQYKNILYLLTTSILGLFIRGR